MIHQTIERPRLLMRVWTVVRDGLPRPGRYKRYIVAMAPCLAVIWSLTTAYILFAPSTFESRFTLILPGSGAGGSLNVASIGQAQSSATSAFSSATLSPTENYKRLLMADVTLRSAAKLIGEESGSLPDPTVKLIDQTNLIDVAIAGRSPAQAAKRAEGLRKAFLAQLDRLRRDEADKREVSDARHLRTLEVKVRDAQQKLINFQATSGLVSLDQFNSRIAALDALKDKERDVRVALREQSAETGRYSGILRTGMGGANTSLRLQSDPQFQKLADRYAGLDVEAEQKAATLGDQHSAMVQANSERDQLRDALVRRGRELTGMGAKTILDHVDISVSGGRSSLMQSMVTSEARRAGTGAGLAEIRGDIARQSARSGQLVEKASQLADLVRDHQIAEAVFSSALARLDTNKQDPFASYPLVQTLEEPSLPNGPSSPSIKIALIGAVAASFFVLIGFLLVWLRQPLIRRFLPHD